MIMQSASELGARQGMEPGSQADVDHHTKQTSNTTTVQPAQRSMQAVGQKRMSPDDSEMQCVMKERKRMDSLFAAIDVTEAADAQKDQDNSGCNKEGMMMPTQQDDLAGHVAKRPRVDCADTADHILDQQNETTITASRQQSIQSSPKSQVLCSLAAVQQHAEMPSAVTTDQRVSVSNDGSQQNGVVKHIVSTSTMALAPPAQPVHTSSLSGAPAPLHSQMAISPTNAPSVSPAGRTLSAPNATTVDNRPAVSMNHSSGHTTMSQDRVVKQPRTATSVQKYHGSLPSASILPPASLQLKQTSNGLLVHTLGTLPRSASDDESGNSQHTALRMVPGPSGPSATTPQAGSPNTIANNDGMAQRSFVAHQTTQGVQVLYPPQRVGQAGPGLATHHLLQQNVHVMQPAAGQHGGIVRQPGGVQQISSTPSPVHVPAGNPQQMGAGQTVVLVQRPDGKGVQLVQLSQQQMQQLQGQGGPQPGQPAMQHVTNHHVVQQQQQQHVYAGNLQPHGNTLAGPSPLQQQPISQQQRFAEPVHLPHGMQVRPTVSQQSPSVVTHDRSMQFLQQPQQHMQPVGQPSMQEQQLMFTTDGRIIRVPAPQPTQNLPHMADTNSMHTVMRQQPAASVNAQYVLQQTPQTQLMQHHGVGVGGMDGMSGTAMQQHVSLATSLNSAAPMPQGSHAGLNHPVSSMHWQQANNVRPSASANGIVSNVQGPQQMYAVNANGELVLVSRRPIQMPARVSHGLTTVQGPLQTPHDALPLPSSAPTAISQQPTLSSASAPPTHAQPLSRQGTVSSANGVAGLQPPAGMQVVQLGRSGELAVVPAGGDCVAPDRSQNLVISMARVVTQGEIDRALKEVLEVMMHKPRGRPVKYIDVGVNRMALKYHVGIRLSGRVESMGATDTELAAHMLLDMVKIGLGLYVDAAAAATPAPGTHPEEQMTSTLAYHPSNYSTGVVQRVIAQLINRNLIATSELSHAYTRATRAGCVPGPCYMSVASALSAFC